MSYVAPNSIVEYYGDMRLSPSYSDTLYFANYTARDAYFNALTPRAREEKVTYVKEERKFRSALPMSTLIYCNYMRFRNTSFESKWFYAFITNVEYINNGMAEVTFELDLMVTWAGVYNVGQCFVEREHSATDNIGDNLVEEKLDIGEYVTKDVKRSGKMSNWSVAVQASVGRNALPFYGTKIGQLFSGLTVMSFDNSTDPDSDTSIVKFIKAVTDANKADAIISMYMVPSDLFSSSQRPETATVVVERDTGALDGYTPKNNKLHTFPYKFILASTGGDEALEYRYEFFDSSASPDANIRFRLESNFIGGVSIMSTPLYYAGVETSLNNSLTMNDFPQVAWSVDTYRAWYAMNKNRASLIAGASPEATNLAIGGAVLKGVGNLLSGNIGGAIGGAVNDYMAINEALLADKDRRTLPPTTRGNSSPDILVAYNQKDFYYNRKTITAQYARIIDEYFTMFGYATKRVKTPNRAVRSRFTYTKTIGCNVHGNLPAEDCRKIESIFNNGVRFWHSHTDIGNYSSANTPV